MRFTEQSVLTEVVLGGGRPMEVGETPHGPHAGLRVP
jgi:hypothetical protein